ncbi:hypothetical protein PAAL109150_12075 [Paenibacillus alkaliterrae]
MLLQKRLNERRVMNFRIIQYKNDVLILVLLQQFFQERQKFLSGILDFLSAKHFSCFVIQRTDQLGTMMLP